MTRVKQLSLAGAILASLVAAAVLTASSTADAQSPHQGSAPVNIVSPLPLPIRDVDQAARQPFQFSDAKAFDGFTGVITVVAVPAGKRLVIEHVSAFVRTQTGGVTSAGLSAGTFVDSVPCTTMSIDFNGRNNFTCSALTKAFVEADRTLLFFATTSAGTGGFLQAFVSGYYVPVP